MQSFQLCMRLFVLLSSTEFLQLKPVPSRANSFSSLHWMMKSKDSVGHRYFMSSLLAMGLILKFLKPLSPGILNP